MKKLLIVDDAPLIRILLRNILKDLKLHIIEAENGNEAIKKFKKEKPDIVLLDVLIQKKSGLEVLKEIMALNPKAKVLMVTAVAQNSFVEKAMKYGAIGYVTKPFNSKLLNKKIKQILKA